MKGTGDGKRGGDFIREEERIQRRREKKVKGGGGEDRRSWEGRHLKKKGEKEERD